MVSVSRIYSTVHSVIGAMVMKILVLFYLISVAASQDYEFTYNGFNLTELYLDGLAEITPNGILKLTNTSLNKQGRAFYPTDLRFQNTSTGNSSSFSTCFAFAIVSEVSEFSGHGLTFVLSPTKKITDALPNQYLGLFNSKNNGNSSNHIIAIEFDTIDNLDFGDIDNNHVGIDVNGLRSINAAPAAYFTTPDGGFKNFSLFSGEPIVVWVEYNDTERQLNVTIFPIDVPKPSVPLLSSSVNLSSIISDTMYVGFSSATGSVLTSHYVLGWSFKMNGQAPALSLSSLPWLPQTKKSWVSTSVISGFSVLTLVFMIITISGILLVVGRKLKYAEVIEDWEREYRAHRFSYKDLFKATRGFKDEELLGVGGFGCVYRGVLPKSKTNIAVKKISKVSMQGMREFVAEIVSIGRLRHRNVVQLLGYCRRKDELLLVYDFIPNGSLDKFLFDQTGSRSLSWSQRFQVVKGVASGLIYLHEEWEQVVVHRDIKASNILLDDEMVAKLGDFGLSRLYDHGSDPKTTHIVGTLGYIAPELTKIGKPTTCTDVFAFGVFLLEVACGRRPIEQLALPEELNLVTWVWRCWRNGVILESRDPRLGCNCVMDELELVLKVGLLCSHTDPARRPTMRQVLQLLDGDSPFPLIHADAAVIWSPGSFELSVGDYSPSYPST